MATGWNAYISNLQASSTAIKRAAIVGFPDGSVWARTEGDNTFKATEAELKKFVAHFNKISDVPATGADLEEVHYVVPRVEENMIFGKKANTGFFASRSKTAVVIAVYEGETHVGSQVRDAVERMAKYLSDSNY